MKKDKIHTLCRALSVNTYFKGVVMGVIACAVFLTGNYLHANWSNPTANPPQGNVAAPINTSGSNQFKDGGAIGADVVRGFNLVHSLQNIRAANNIIAENNVIAQNNLRANNQVRSDQYCDRSGENCFSPEGGAGGGSIRNISFQGWIHGFSRGGRNQAPRRVRCPDGHVMVGLRTQRRSGTNHVSLFRNMGIVCGELR